MSSTIRDQAVSNFIDFMKSRGTKKSASVGVYSGTVRLLRNNISAAVSVPKNPKGESLGDTIRGLTLNSKDDTEWNKICAHMNKWAKTNNTTSRKKGWLTLSQTIRQNKKEWVIKWKNNPRMTSSLKKDIETSFKTEMSEEVKTAYANAFDGYVDSIQARTEYEHGTEREIDYSKGKTVEGYAPATNFQGQKGSYTDIALKKSMKQAVDNAIKSINKNFKDSSIISITDIFNGFLTEYIGGEHVLKKDRGTKGFNDVLEFIAEITLEDQNAQNPGALNTAISEAFKNIFGKGDKPTPEFVRLATKYAEISDIKKIENLWTSSDKPSKAIPELAMAKMGKELSKGKNIKLSKELKKKIKTDKKVSRSRIPGKKLKTKTRKSGKALAASKVTETRARQANSAVALKELLNAALPEEMLKRMNPPALRNRTGRFRTSAEVTNVLVGPKGGVNIDYTYMKYPYQTFEPGFAQGSTGRDPRRLIGGTIREIAGDLMGKKFIKVRRI
jgi:hypothetical protein